MKKTKDYNLFVFRDDNRAKITQEHVDRLALSIKAKNMLELRPIIVNKNMEILDGQHRFLAAKKLGVEIWYEEKKDGSAEDIIQLNISKAWGLHDYLNFYARNGKKEYVKLEQFAREKNLTISTAINVTSKKQGQSNREFKEGNYVFSMDDNQAFYDICINTIEIIKKNCTHVPFVRASRFWRALFRLVSHPDFEEDKWYKNVEKFSERISSKATTRETLKMLIDIHNHTNPSKILLSPEEYFPKENDEIKEREEKPKERHKQYSFSDKLETARNNLSQQALPL